MTMKKKAATKAKAVKAVRTDDVWHPPPHPPRKRPPKNNLGHVPELFRDFGLSLGPDLPRFLRAIGRPMPRIRPPKSAAK